VVISPDEVAETVRARLQHLAGRHPAGFERLDALIDASVTIYAPDAEADPGFLDLFRLNQAGLDNLDRLLYRERQEGALGLVVIDAYANLIPPGGSENDNPAAALAISGLEQRAQLYFTAVLILHHGRKQREGDDEDTVDARGAGAFVASARTVFGMTTLPGNLRHLRKVTTIKTNLGRKPKPALFQVAEPDAGDGLFLFSPHDREAQYTPRELLGDGPLTMAELAWKIQGQEPADGKRPSGSAKELAGSLVQRWEAERLVVVEPGRKANSKQVRLATPAEAVGEFL